MKRYESYKDSGVKWLGEIPGHWGMYKLKYLFKLNKTKNVGNKCNTILSLSYGKIKIKQDLNEGLTPESYEGYQLLNDGDIVIRSTDLQNDHTSLRTGLVKNDGAITSAYIGLKNLDKKKYDSRYYHYFLHDWDITKAIYNEGKGLRQSLNWDDIKNMLLPVLDINEQTAIANYLDTVTSKIDLAISQQKKMIDLLNERKQIIIQNAVTKGLDPNVRMKDSGVEWIGEIPEDWKVRRIKYSIKLINNKTTEKLPYIELDNIESKSGMLLSYSSNEPDSICNAFKKGDILFCKLRPYLAKCIIAEINGKCSSELLVLRHFVGEIKYLKYLLLSRKLIDLINESTYGAKMPRANWSFIGNCLIPIPNKDVQKLISDHLDNITSKIDSSISQCNKMISLLQERKQIIINDVVTGKVKVI